MKAKRTILIFAIWGLCTLGFKWFENEMYQLFTPFLLMIPYIFLFISLIVFGIWAIVFLVKRRKERFKAVIPLIIFIPVFVLFMFVPFYNAKINVEYALYTGMREQVVADIQTGQLMDDGIGNVNLPFGRRFLSRSGEVSIIEHDEDGIIVGFWIFRGLIMGSFEMMIYTSYAQPPTSPIVGRQILSIERYGENWYYILAK